MRRISTQIEIEASAARVWEVLTDFATYGEWNPFIKNISGLPLAEEKLRVRMQSSDSKTMTFKPRVVVADDGEKFCWQGSLGVRGLFDGMHCFEIESISEKRVHFKHSETFSGLLIPLFGKVFDRTERGFEAMNQALKKRAEDEAV